MPEEDARNDFDNLIQSSETLQASQTIQSPNDISHSYSINTIPSIRPEYVISDDFFAGHRSNGQMSSVRRFFCLFVTFDLLFTVLMWLICIMLNGDNIILALKKAIYQYNVHTSLFDVVFVALCRFLILILFYAIIYINHWLVIALSTFTTCFFLISKVFVFDWQTTNQPVFQVLLVLISFVLSWGEAWFLDFRVIPQEFNARQILLASSDTERTPLVRNYVQNLPSMYTESFANYYSPAASPEGSLDGFQQVVPVPKYPPVKLTPEMRGNYKELGEKILSESWDLLKSNDWKLKKDKDGDKVYVLNNKPTIGKIYKLTGILEANTRCILEILFYKVDKITKWNPALLESHKIQTIDENTDICYQISAKGGKGAVDSRDFVTFRYWSLKDKSYVIACTGVEHPSIPIVKDYVRGESRVSCLVMSPIENKTNQCEFQWVLNMDLKGSIPQFVLETAFTTMLFDYIKHLRKYVNKLKQS